MGDKAGPGFIALAAVALLLVIAPPVFAEGPPIQVNPNRPTFATPALTTQSGVVELEFGGARSQLEDGVTVSSPFLLKLGLTKRLELRIGGNGIVHATHPDTSPATGYGDSTIGAQWTFLPDGPLGIDEAVQVTWTLPTGAASEGLGGGGQDLLVMLLLSRDFWRFHADLNFLNIWLGHKAPQPRDTQPAGTLSVSRTLGERWSLTGEVYSIGATPANGTVVSNLWAISYKVSSRLVLDSGFDVGLSQAAAKISVFAGLTVGLARFRHPDRP